MENIETAFKKGILKTTRAKIEEIKSRSYDYKTGKVVTGAEGKMLNKKKKMVKDYFKRNRKK